MFMLLRNKRREGNYIYLLAGGCAKRDELGPYGLARHIFGHAVEVQIGVPLREHTGDLPPGLIRVLRLWSERTAETMRNRPSHCTSWTVFAWRGS